MPSTPTPPPSFLLPHSSQQWTGRFGGGCSGEELGCVARIGKLVCVCVCGGFGQPASNLTTGLLSRAHV